MKTYEITGALDKLVMGVEEDLGGRLDTLTVDDKKKAVRMLLARGAFQLRRSVEDIADELDVTRTSVYNWMRE